MKRMGTDLESFQTTKKSSNPTPSAKPLISKAMEKTTLALAINSAQAQDPDPMTLALNFVQMPDDDQTLAPDEIELVPGGHFGGRDGRSWHNPTPQAVIEATRRYGRDIPIDIEHATEIKAPKGEPAPAQAWIRRDALFIRNGAVWGTVEWNDSGRQYVESKGYRYYSPAFYFSETGQVIRIKSVGLTNGHNLDLPALNHEVNPKPTSTKGETDMPLSEALRSALSLNETASEADAVQAIGKLKEDKQLALNRAENPDLQKYVPKETHTLALNRAQQAEKDLADYRAKEMVAEVDAAIEARKIAPANKDQYLALCRQEGGLENFRAIVKNAPEIISGEAGKGGKKKEEAAATKLTDEQIALCRQMDITEDEFLSSLKEQA